MRYIVLALLVVGCSQSKPDPPVAKPAEVKPAEIVKPAEPVKAVSPAFAVGDVVPLVSGGDVILADDPFVYARFIQLLKAGDTVGQRELLNADSVFLMPPGTKARVISDGDTLVEVRIVGERKDNNGGRAAYVSRASIGNPIPQSD